MKVKVSQMHLTLCNAVDYTVHGILHARILEQVDVYFCRASLVAKLVKNEPAMQETLVQFLGWDNILEKG